MVLCPIPTVYFAGSTPRSTANSSMDKANGGV